MVIVTHKIGNYPQLRLIFSELGHKVVNLSSYRQVDHTAFDGLILLGGADVSPILYEQKPKYPGSRSDWDRDEFELYLLETAFEREVPILAICRGMQLLNVACQGSLWQDLSRDGIGEIDHRAYHPIMVKGGLFNKIPLTVNSRHHQAVNRVGFGFEPVAFSYDGVIEAIYRPGALGVQWHPEDLYFEDSRWSGLFEWFTEGLK